MTRMKIEFDDYQLASQRTMPLCSTSRDNILNFTIGLCGESGEFADYIKKCTYQGKVIDIEKINLSDLKTFQMLARGETMGLFQLNGSGMTQKLIKLKPTTIHDINAMAALYRPGPLESIPEYIKRKHNPRTVRFLDPRMKDILSQSYGVITYQDDVMLIAIKLGGYSWLEADKLRKAMGKKDAKELDGLFAAFKAGMLANGFVEEAVTALWDTLLPFAG